MPDPLLPPSLRQDPNVAALADVLAGAIQAVAGELERLLVYRIAEVPAVALPVLAQQFHADWWSAAEPVWRQRELVAALLLLHRRKGTAWSVREQLARLGQPEAELIERAQAHRHNGQILRDGDWYFDGHAAGWAIYAVRLTEPVTFTRARQMVAAIKSQAPARCRLVRLHYPEASLQYDATVFHDGAYTRGAIETTSWEE